MHPMDLSVIIVSYNVKYFLEQCLHAAIRSAGKADTQIIVIDNHSVDGSCEMVREKFPGITLIVNNENTGFSRATNQGIQIATGRCILLLNPDTVVEEDTFRKCLDFMDSHPEAGSLGVKMIDGNGKYLPESKRSLPTPEVAFYKIFGLSALFPRSKRFGRYHLGYLDRDAVHQVDVLSGAFMFIRREALEKAGLLDEDFFMYGEDIDLSLRIKKMGYVNYYFPETTIIHYKGESTRKSSINYVIMFYQAMSIFARKHFSSSALRYFNAFIHIAIYFRAGISIIQRFATALINPLVSAVLIYTGYHLFLPVWATYLFGPDGSYPDVFMRFIVPSYVIIWMLSIYFAGGFERSVRFSELVKGVLLGTILILMVYALLPEHLRFSRALILIGTLWALLVFLIVRVLLAIVIKKHFRFAFLKRRRRVMIAGGPEECFRVVSMLNNAGLPYDLVGFVSEGERQDSFPGLIGQIGQIDEIAFVNRVEEIIFCAGGLKATDIIKAMLKLSGSDIEFKIAPPESLSIIGSRSIGLKGDLFDIHYNALSERTNRRKKRLFDVTASVFLFVACPFLTFLVESPPAFFRNLFRTFLGFTTWVSIYKASNEPSENYGLKPGILTPVDGMATEDHSPEALEEMNMMYAKDYSILNDVRILMHALKKLGNRHS